MLCRYFGITTAHLPKIAVVQSTCLVGALCRLWSFSAGAALDDVNLERMYQSGAAGHNRQRIAATRLTCTPSPFLPPHLSSIAPSHPFPPSPGVTSSTLCAVTSCVRPGRSSHRCCMPSTGGRSPPSATPTAHGALQTRTGS